MIRIPYENANIWLANFFIAETYFSLEKEVGALFLANIYICIFKNSIGPAEYHGDVIEAWPEFRISQNVKLNYA